MPNHEPQDPNKPLGSLTLTGEDPASSPEPIIYNVYQQEAQDPNLEAGTLQNLYGTSAMPVFEWVKTIVSGQRSYTPGNDFDDSMLEEYEKLQQQGQVPEELNLPTTAQIVAGISAPVLQAAGQGALRGLSDVYMGGDLSAAVEGATTAFRPFTTTPAAEVSSIASDAGMKLVESGQLGTDVFAPELAGGRTLAEKTGQVVAFDKLNETGQFSQIGKYDPAVLKEAGFTGPTIDAKGAVKAGANPATTELVTKAVSKPTYFGGVKERLGFSGDFSGIKSAGVNGLISLGVNLASGMKPKQAIKSAGAAAIGSYIGQALIPIPVVGGAIGSVVGSLLGGRVICNELCRQGIMTRKQVALDYKFTRDYLTPQHVNGYHVWSVWMVRQMRKGKFVKFWKHVAGHRANEIAYIYGERDKPDYLGKIYRKILEPVCWSVGYFCEKTDWSTLYNQKEV